MGAGLSGGGVPASHGYGQIGAQEPLSDQPVYIGFRAASLKVAEAGYRIHAAGAAPPFGVTRVVVQHAVSDVIKVIARKTGDEIGINRFQVRQFTGAHPPNRRQIQ